MKQYFENPDDLKEKFSPGKIARIIGEHDISFFALYYMREIFVVSDDNSARPLAPEHYHMWKILNDVFVYDKFDKVNFVKPRGFAKTTVNNLLLEIWLVCYKKSKFTLIGAKKDDDAQQFLNSIKITMQTCKYIKEEFGNLIDTKSYKADGSERYKINQSEIEFTNNTYVRCVGSGTSVRGANWGGIRPTVVILDDYQSEIDILTDDAREKKYNRFTKEVEQVGDTAVYRGKKKIKPATKFVNVGTVLHIDCLISRISRNKDYYTSKSSAIILKDGETVDDIFESDLWTECKRIYFDDSIENPKQEAEKFYREHEFEMKHPLLWEEKWDFFNDIAIKYWENRISFMSELMNDAVSIGERWFKSVRTQSVEEIEKHGFVKTILVVDPAGSKGKKSDNTAMIVGSLGDNGFKYCRHLIREKLSFDEICTRIIELLKEYEDITHLDIEKNTFQGADVIKIQELMENDEYFRHRHIEIINERAYKNKDERISTIIDEVNNGQIIFVDNNREFVQEILDFQGQDYSIHDDAPDATARFSIMISTINPVSYVTCLDRSALGI